MKKILLLIAILFVALESMAVDPRIQNDLRNARSLERSGKQAEALALYEKAFHEHPEYQAVFPYLRNAYMKAKMYDKLIEACNIAMKIRPKDVSIRLALGEAWVSKGYKARAKEIWENAIHANPSNRSYYSLVAYQLSRYRMDEDAVNVYLRGEEALGQPHTFARELARAYEKTGDYKKATEELLNTLVMKPKDIFRVERELKRLASRSGRSMILKTVKSRAEKEPKWPVVHRILGDLYLLEGRYDQAMKEYGMTGAEEPLWELAERAEREGLYDTALRSYQTLAQGKGKYSSMASFRIGSVLEASKKYEEAIDAHKRFIHDFPRDTRVSQAKYRIGLVRVNGLSDPRGALPYFESLADSRAREGVGLDSRFMIADCNLRLGNLKRAALELESVVDVDGSSRALFLLGETTYFQGDFDSALAIYEKVATQFPKSDYVNDALWRSVFINDNSDDRKLLHRIAGAQRLLYSRDYDSAIKDLKALLRDEPGSSLADDCVLLVGEALEGKDSYNEAIAAYKDLAKLYPESRLRPEAKRRIGELFAEKLNDKKAAIKELEEVLLKFPDYVLASTVRNRIEKLKGDDHP